MLLFHSFIYSPFLKFYRTGSVLPPADISSLETTYLFFSSKFEGIRIVIGGDLAKVPQQQIAEVWNRHLNDHFMIVRSNPTTLVTVLKKEATVLDAVEGMVRSMWRVFWEKDRPIPEIGGVAPQSEDDARSWLLAVFESAKQVGWEIGEVSVHCGPYRIGSQDQVVQSS